MKKIITLCISLLFVIYVNGQLLVPKSLNKEGVNPPRIEIDGLGSISNTQTGENISPSANVFIKFLPIPQDIKGKTRFYLGFNLGAELDSTNADSIKIARLFLPDQSKTGYISRLSYNFLPFIINIINNKKPPISLDEYENSNKDGYKFTTELSPFIEFNYNKLNIKGVHEDSSKIQTTTWITGLNFVHQIVKEQNAFSFHLNYFHKWVSITDGTFGVYQRLYRKNLRNAADEQTLKFIGISAGMQINRFLFSFSYEDLKNEKFERTPLYGGVFTIKATVIGDFIKL